MVEHSLPTKRQLDFSAGINMAGPVNLHGKEPGEVGPRNRPRYDNKRYLTEAEVKSVRYRKPLSEHLLNKYEQQYDRRWQYDSSDGEYRRPDAYRRESRRRDQDDERSERRAKGKSKEQGDIDRHWDCPFFKHCWNSGMIRLPTVDNCPECSQQKKDKSEGSVFDRLGPLPPRRTHAESSQRGRAERSAYEEEDACHRQRWCPDGLSHSQKRRVQCLRSLEEAEAPERLWIPPRRNSDSGR